MMNTLHRWASQKYAWQLWLIPFLLISPAVFVIPVDVFTQYPWARGYTDFMASIVPMIDRTAHLHPHPDKFRVFYAYAWSWLPALCGLNWWVMGLIPEKMDAYWESQKNRQITMFFLHLMMIFGFYLIFFAPGDKVIDTALLARADRRYGLYKTDFALLWSAPFAIFYIASMLVLQAKHFTRVVRKLSGNGPTQSPS